MSNPMQQTPPDAMGGAPQPPAAPTKPGAAPMFLMILAVVGIVSCVLDFVAGGQFVDAMNAAYKKLGESTRVTASDFNIGTMYLNLVLTVVLGIMGTLVRSGKNGARITGAILAIFTTLGGIVGGVIVMLDGAADSLMQTQAHTSVLPGWYFPLGLLVVVAQVVLSLLATITLFGSKAKTHCTTPQP